MKYFVSLLAYLVLLFAAPVYAQTYALDDLSNVDAATLGKVEYVSSTATCSDVQTALATGNSVYLPRGSYVWNNCYLTMTTSGQSIIGAGRHATFVQFTYTGAPTGPAITIGNTGSTPTRVDSVTIRSLHLTTAPAQYAIWTRYVRGLRLIDNYIQADGLMRLGDNTLTPGCDTTITNIFCTTYIVELYDGNELHQYDAPSATLHFVKAENFGGQFVSQNTFAEGKAVPGIDGFHSAGNVVDLEHGVVEGGYWSRFDVNWNFKQGRPAGWFFSHHFSELALTNAFLFEANGSGVVEGCNNIFIDHTVVDAGAEAIVFRTSAVGKLCQDITLTGIASFGAHSLNKSVVLFDASAGTIKKVTVNGVTGFIDAATNTDFIYLKGSSGATLKDVEIGQVNAESTSANPLRSVVRVEGSGNTNISVGNQVTGVNSDVAIDDQSGVLIRPREPLTADRTYYVRSDGANTNSCLANTAAGACLTIQSAWDRIALLDLRGFNVTIQVADATYTGGLLATKVPLGGGTVVIRGNSSTPGNVIVSTTSASALSFPTKMTAIVTVRDMKLQTTTSGDDLKVGSATSLNFFNILFGACAGAHLTAQASGAVITAAGGYSITGNAIWHVYSDFGGQIVLDSRTVTLTGMPAFSSFAAAARFGYVGTRSTTFSGSATGNRYSVTSGAIVDTNGGGATFLPGSGPGAVSLPGAYI